MPQSWQMAEAPDKAAKAAGLGLRTGDGCRQEKSGGKKMKKRTLALMMTAVMTAASLAGCGGGSSASATTAAPAAPAAVLEAVPAVYIRRGGMVTAEDRAAISSGREVRHHRHLALYFCHR